MIRINKPESPDNFSQLLLQTNRQDYSRIDLLQYSILIYNSFLFYSQETHFDQ